MFLGSEKNLIDSLPPSLPSPESFMPPKGVLKSLKFQAFTQTIPKSIILAPGRAKMSKNDVQNGASEKA